MIVDIVARDLRPGDVTGGRTIAEVHPSNPTTRYRFVDNRRNATVVFRTVASDQPMRVDRDTSQAPTNQHAQEATNIMATATKTPAKRAPRKTTPVVNTKPKAKTPAKPTRPTTPRASTKPVEVVDGKTRLSRLAAAKTETAKLKAWEAKGSKGRRPATPNLDALEAESKTDRKPGGAKKGPVSTGAGRTLGVHTKGGKSLTDDEVRRWIAKHPDLSWSASTDAIRESGRSCSNARFRRILAEVESGK